MRQYRLVVDFRQFTQQTFLFGVKLFGDFNEDLDQQITGPSSARIDDALAGNGEDFTVLRARLDPQLIGTIQGRDVDLGAKCSLAEGDRQLEYQVDSIPLEQFVRSNGDEDVAIADGTTVGTGLALTGHPNAHAVIDAGGDRDGQFRLLVLQPRPPALHARLADLLSRSPAIRTSGLDAEDACRLDHLSSSAAGGASRRLAARGRTTARTNLTADTSAEGDILVDSASRLFQRQRDVTANIGSAASPPASSPA